MTSHLPSHLYFAATLYDHLLRYHRGDFVFSSPRQSMMASGIALEDWASGHSEILDRADQLLARARDQGWRRALLMSAIGFDVNTPSRLVIPRYVEAMPQVGHNGLSSAPPQSTVSRDQPAQLTAMSPTPQAYQDLVSKAVRSIREGEFEKVVLSRSLSVQARVDLAALLATLAQRNPAGYTFAFDRQHQGQQRTLVGASPELLLSKCGPQILSNPLAGSLPRSQSLEENQRRANELMHSEKDRYEHALVVDAVATALAPFCKHLSVPPEPSVLETPTMLHLSTAISGELHAADTSSLALALALHPTPAVCGHPRQPAHHFIQQQEGFDRSLFTGLVGWCGQDGNGEWAVTIRCADVGDNDATLYAGAGIVEGSQPDKELTETSAKMSTMLAAMGLESLMEASL